MVDPGQLPLGVGGVAGDKPEIGILQGDEPAFRVQLRDPQAVTDRKRFGFREDGGAGVAFFLGGVPKLTIAGELQ